MCLWATQLYFRSEEMLNYLRIVWLVLLHQWRSILKCGWGLKVCLRSSTGCDVQKFCADYSTPHTNL